MKYATKVINMTKEVNKSYFDIKKQIVAKKFFRLIKNSERLRESHQFQVKVRNEFLDSLKIKLISK